MQCFALLLHFGLVGVSEVMLEVVLSAFVVSHSPLEQQVRIRKVGMRQMLPISDQEIFGHNWLRS